jgi:predicted MarR family transcription regulator
MAARPGKSKVSNAKPATLHIGRTEKELALFEFQHAAICFIEAFYRHIECQLIAITGDPNLSAQDCVILHSIRLGERPKSITDIQHFSNRRDVANIQYSVRKLIGAGLVQKARREAGRGTFYEPTKHGIHVTDIYVETRARMMREFLSDRDRFLKDAETATRLMMMLTGIYDHLSRTDALRPVGGKEEARL